MRKKLLKTLLAALTIGAADNASAQCTATLTSINNTTCENDSIMLQAYPPGATQYEWFVNGVSQGLGGSSYIDLQPAGTYTYYVIITDNNNCVAQSNAVTTTLASGPTVSVSNNGPICEGNTLQLNATSNGTTYNWWGPNGFTSTQQNPQIVNAQSLNSGNYYVAVSDGNCTTTAMTNAVVNNSPGVGAFSYTNGICVGDTFSLVGGYSYLTNVTYGWSGPNGFSSTLENPLVQNTTLASAGTYTFTVSGTSCNGPVTISASLNMAVGNTPVVSVANNGPVCAGNTLQLTGSVSSGTYSWTGPGSFTSTQLSPSITNAQVNNSGFYTLTATDNGCTVSATTNSVVMTNNATAYAWSDSSVCVGGAINLGAVTNNITGATYSWTGPNGFTSTSANNTINSATSANDGTYTVVVTGGIGCGGTVNITSSTNVNVSSCDSVWPGDANSDFVVTNIDALNIGLGYGATGAARTGATTNWVAQYCNNWNSNFNNAVNYKHADCNGDGTIDDADTVAIGLNYGMTHQKGGHTPQSKVTGFPDLFFDMSNVMLTPGATVTIPIKLGTSSIMVQDIYGIAAQVKIDGIIPATDMIVSGVSGWMGNSSNTISFQKAIGTAQTDWAYVRKDHSNVTGEGVIGALTFTVPMGSDNQMVNLYFDNVKMISNNGDEIQDFNVIDGNAEVYPTSVATTGGVINSAVIAPNPSDAHAVLQLTTAQASKIAISVVDIVGKAVWTATQNTVAGVKQIALPAADVAPGIYTILITDDKGSVVQTLRWVKK